ncbi:type IV secretion system DNA-binding domain-containing protein [Enterobacter hormaechei]|uniref:Type IV secretion system DNA-binding domain-containing protein n=2 Tax=Enterobacter cloacae complex TaxID=354276 RepID=A0AAE4EBJ3_9ENTR|nr:type IV secretion system DNA-binding domain-containing protein [Enterobacter hormaechei]MDS0021965.1 type IV secretion system DNA-binding domain-containing protein [Enterobacter hormaechei subsp. steigerwaltii]UGH77273.1 type IV secretion system DNA-binding domain-containing protein [Escherichia coli]HCQ0255492.1 type IV secretion system DNA-binding domain-containing protein [Escherichia coli]HDV8102025.1 type IV secretion system DNA-binding domain-containing protein [Escherichia coli]
MLDQKQEKSTVSDLNRGGQVLMHFIRMLHQTLTRYFKIVLCVFVIVTTAVTYQITDKTDWYMGLKYGYSYTLVELIGLKKGKTTLELPDGRKVMVMDAQIVSSPTMQNHADTLISNLLISLLVSSIVALIAAWYLFRFILNKGKQESKDEHRRGAELTTVEELIEAANDRVKEDGRPSRISIANVPLVRYQENSGIALLGSPGVGKSTIIRELLRQLRAQQRKAVLYDISGEFVKRFYRPGKDVILNVFDTRSHSWDLWAEGKNPAMYDRMAKAAIPDNNGGGDPFWIEAPRLLFSALLEQLGKRYDVPSVEHLMNIILRMPNDKIANVVATTDARNVMNLDLDKMAGSVRAVITAYTRNFKHLALPTGPRFSFKNWAQDEDSDAWVFITVRDDMKDTLRPMITMMIESALSAILTLEPSQDRLIGTSIDEAGTLQEIPSLPDFMSTCRKFGGFPILGFQSNAQTDVVYGEKKSQILMDGIGAIAAFRINGSKGAAWLADQLGDQETEKSSENTSYGANDVRDATSINRQDKEGNLILRSQITALPDNTCYLKLGRGLPVAKIKFPYDHMKELHPGIIENESLNDTSFLSQLSKENEISPEHVVSIINKENSREKREPQKFKQGSKPNPDAGKTQEQVLDEVIDNSAPTDGSKPTSNGEVSNPVAQAMSSVKADTQMNAVAQAMNAANKKQSDAEDQDDEGDFSNLQLDTPVAHDFLAVYESSFSTEQSNTEKNSNNDVTNRNNEKSFDQHEYPGGM